MTGCSPAATLSGLEGRSRVRCPRCQSENRADARFCEECGARMEQSCPSCGNPVGAGKKFCGNCGAALTEKAAEVTALLLEHASR